MKKILFVLAVATITSMLFNTAFATENGNTINTRPSTNSVGTSPSRPSVSTKKTISEIKVTINEPKYGEKLDFNPVMVTEGITFDHMYWSGYNLTTAGGYVGVNENDVATNTKYQATIYFKVNDGYVLDSSLKTGTVNDASGRELVSLSFSPHGIKTQEFTVEKSEAPAEEITGFNINVAEIKVGEALPNSCTYTTNLVKDEKIEIPTKDTITKVYWTQSDEKAKADTEYVLHFEKNLEKAKVSEDYRVMVNNVEVSGYKITNGILEFNYRVKTPADVSKEEPVEASQETKYKVAFNANGGNNINTQEVDSNGKVNKPADPTKEGFTFAGWYADEKLEKAFDFNTAITKDVTLYAKWDEVKKEDTKKEEAATSGENTKTEEPVNTIGATKISWTSASAWAIDELNKANDMGIIPTIFDKQDLTKNITRKEFAHIAVKLWEKISGKTAVADSKNPFTDTNDQEVLKAYNLDITKGTSETTFDPDALITREQMATMMTRALSKAGKDTAVDLNKVNKFADDSKMHDWGKESIYYMSNIEIIKGVGNNTFDVLGNATREQALLISERSAEKFAK